MTAPAARGAGDAVEAVAAARCCPRHVPLMRACQYAGGEPCWCRAGAEREGGAPPGERPAEIREGIPEGEREGRP